MNPLRVSALNYRTFERLDVDLPTGTVAIVGPNGAGKSSILNVVDVALFAGRGELADLLTVGEDELTLELEFEHAGELYRVRRQFSARGRGKTTLDFEREDEFTPGGGGPGVGWEPLTRETAEQTQQLICDTIGLSRTTFRASSFLRQGDGAAFTEASPRDRKAILAEILGLDLWDRLQKYARDELRGCEDDLVKVGTLIAGCDELVARKPLVVGDVQTVAGEEIAAMAEVATAEEILEAARARLAEAAAAMERIRACEAEHAAADTTQQRALAALSEAQQAAERLVDKTIELNELAADADRIPALEEQLTAAHAQAAAAADARRRRGELEGEAGQRELARDRMVAQALQLHQEAQAARGKADHLDAHIQDAGSCDRCGQTLGAEAAARAAASYRAEAEALDARGRQLDETNEEELAAIAGVRALAATIEVPADPDIEPLELDLRAARAAGERRATVAEQVRQLTEKVEAKLRLEEEVSAATSVLASKQQQLDEARAQDVDENAAAAVETARVTLAAHRDRLDQVLRRGAALDAELARIVTAEKQLAEHRHEVAAVQGRVDVLKIADRAYGRDGIPALIVENAAIPQLEVEANRILGELGGGTADCRIELRTQRALKTTESLRETLDIVIVTPSGERAYETFSGGERTRLNLALRISLARLLAHRRGAESRLLAIDEPEFLDEAGTARLGDVLRGLAGDFDRVLLVSHHPTLAAAFDTSIVVVKDGDRSRIDAGVAAVAA